MSFRFRNEIINLLARKGLDIGARLSERPFFTKLIHSMLYLARSGRGRDPFNSLQWKFLARVVMQKERSRSQLFQDLWVLHELSDKTGGFFVEFGAADGEYLSNTWLLEKEYGWQGILAEPAPSWHAALKRNRSAKICTACVHATSGMRLQLRIPPGGAEFSTTLTDMSSHKHARKFQDYEEVEVDTISLNDLLECYGAPKNIDYISMDVEGAEIEILESFDFSQYRVDLWSIEHNGAERADLIDKIMEAHGYCRCFPEFSRFDAWYRRVED